MTKKNTDPMRFYVYLHRRKDNNEVFYVGKGCGSRATTKNKRSLYWTRVANKYGFSVEFVDKGLSEQDSLDLEVETIRFYRDNGHELCNHTDGGEGTSGWKPSEDTLEKFSLRANSPEFKSMMHKAISKPVLCSNGMQFAGCKDAEIWLGNKPSNSKVSTCCRRESLHAGGFVWRFLSDCDDLKSVLSEGKDAFVEWRCQDTLDKYRPKRVYCSNGMNFESVSAGARWYHSIGKDKVEASYISACCNGRKKKLWGLEWSFDDKFKSENCFLETKVAILQSLPKKFDPSIAKISIIKVLMRRIVAKLIKNNKIFSNSLG